jgi:ribosomal protein S18 acetylase RimI-like enzyme
MLNSDTTKVFVAMNGENNEVAAFLVLLVKIIPDRPMIVPGKYVHVDDLCVKKAYRHKGIGKTLFEYAKTYAKSIDAQSVELKVWEFNQDAVKFYEGLGMSTRNRMMEIKL